MVGEKIQPMSVYGYLVFVSIPECLSQKDKFLDDTVSSWYISVLSKVFPLLVRRYFGGNVSEMIE